MPGLLPPADVTASAAAGSSPEQRDVLPGYTGMLAAFHCAFATELREIVGMVPLSDDMRVLDFACGDGFYTNLLAHRLGSNGELVAMDANRACLAAAQTRLASARHACPVEFMQGDLQHVSQQKPFDCVWCAQSLFSLPDPLATLRCLSAVVRPGGLLAILENDTLHQLLLPWPPQLEITLREAEYAGLRRLSRRPHKFYVGRHLPELLLAAGLESVSYHTQAIDRQAPLDPDLTRFLIATLDILARRARPHLEPEVAKQMARLIDASAPEFLLHQPGFVLTWLNVLACARRPE